MRQRLDVPVTLIITVYNEEKRIKEKLENTQRLNYPAGKLQVLVVSDGSTDATNDIVRSYEVQGVELFEVPHDPNFPTDPVIVHGDNKQVWYSPDVAKITGEMLDRMEAVDQIIFDATFLNEDNFPAKKFNHITIEESAPVLVKLKKEIIFSHINHSEDLVKMERFLDRFNFVLAKDGMEIDD